jgi:hypothetical protein
MGDAERRLFDAADWAAITRETLAAADDVNAARIRGRSLVALLVASGQKNTVSGVFHAAIAQRLAALSGGLLPDEVEDEETTHADLRLHGNELEVKTGAVGAAGATISTNKSYVLETPPDSERLLVAANYLLIPDGDDLRIAPVLLRSGWIGPTDYDANAGKGQVRAMAAHGYAKLHTLWHAPVADLPATLVAGIGAGALEGRQGELTIAAARELVGSATKRRALAEAAIDSIRGRVKAKWPLPDAPRPAVFKRDLSRLTVIDRSEAALVG